jgi:cell division protein FtsL
MMKNLEDIILTLIVVALVFIVSNLSKRVKKLEENQ